jgi:hypothetical protein
LHGIFDGIRHPLAHCAQKLIGNVGELHTCDAPLFIGPFETAPPLDTSLFVQIERELHFRFRAHPFDGTETKTLFGQIKNHAAIARLYFNIEEVLKPFSRRLPAFEVISHAGSRPKKQRVNPSCQTFDDGAIPQRPL